VRGDACPSRRIADADGATAGLRGHDREERGNRGRARLPDGIALCRAAEGGRATRGALKRALCQADGVDGASVLGPRSCRCGPRSRAAVAVVVAGSVADDPKLPRSGPSRARGAPAEILDRGALTGAVPGACL